MPIGNPEKYDETRKSLERIQNFDVNQLPRKDELGGEMNFAEVVSDAQELIDLFKRLSLDALQDFPDQILGTVLTQANDAYKRLTNILEFKLNQQDPAAQRQSLINSVTSAYQSVFPALHPYISYSLHRSADFQRLDSEARATLQTIQDRAQSVEQKLKSHESDAQSVLQEIRNVAAEEGVTQQASHFRVESEEHEELAEKWLKRAVNLAIAIGIYAVISLFLHEIPWLRPDNAYDTFQLTVSKLLIFSVMAYMLFLSAKNFMNHRHNAIVNKHRQNALMTHRALIEASDDVNVRDAVLMHAASCIFAPQATGYSPTSGEGDSVSPKSVVEILTKPVSKAATDAAKQAA